MKNSYPDNKTTIIGGGIIGALHALYIYNNTKPEESSRVTIFEKNPSINDTTASNIAPSLTPDEILSVIDYKRMKDLLLILFNKPSGIRIEDVPGVNEGEVYARFSKAVQQHSSNEKLQKELTETLLTMGKESMELWQQIYENGDDELKKIFEESNFKPCREPSSDKIIRNDGYRIDLIYNKDDAQKYAEAMKQTYESLDYKHCKILSPSEVVELDPYLNEFCQNNSENNQWKTNAIAIWRPVGCIDAKVFLPKLYEYLGKKMGTYTNEKGEVKRCFQLHFDREVIEVEYNTSTLINSLTFKGGKTKRNLHEYLSSTYIFCPGEAVGTLDKLGFKEPPYGAFAGASLKLNISLSPEQIEKYSNFNHCMEVHQEGVVLAWQSRFVDGQIKIAVAGTKSYYNNIAPHKDQEFCKQRNLLQLNMINDVLPQIISLTLGKDTKGQKLNEEDLISLEQKGIAERWVGRRAVIYDGMPILGKLYINDNNNTLIENAIVTSYLGSGGVSYGPGAVSISNRYLENAVSKSFENRVLNFASSNRNPDSITI